MKKRRSGVRQWNAGLRGAPKKCPLGRPEMASDEICDAAHEIAYLADEAITMAVDAERERCIKIVQGFPVVVHTERASLMERRRQLIALLRGRE